MVVDDKAYSKYTITSPVVLELVNTNAFQRLKGINQLGIPAKYSPSKGYSRYEHSLGVYILLNMLEACEQECIAGLLHDISHTAFSHLIDWVVGDSTKEDYQDCQHLSVLRQPEVANILTKYGYTPEDMGDYKKYNLLESEIPNICVDRIDYSLRDMGRVFSRKIVEDLTVGEGRILFKRKESALLFANNFLSQQVNIWAGYEAVTRYHLLSELLKKAIFNEDISMDDFQNTDKYVINKIISTGKNEYINTLKQLENNDLSNLNRSTSCVFKKFRYVDPQVITNNGIQRLSLLDKDFQTNVAKEMKRNDTGYFPGVLYNT